MTDKYDFFMAIPVASGKVYGCLKKNFFATNFSPAKKNPTTKGSLVAKIPLVTKTSPQEKSRRNENSANNIIDNKNLPTTKRASSEAL